MSFKEFLAEAIKPTDLVHRVGSGRGQLDVTKYLRKTCGVSGKGSDDVYFDGPSLVYGSKTIVAGALNDKSVTVQDLIDAVNKAKQ
jgi:hypothetical protein